MIRFNPSRDASAHASRSDRADAFISLGASVQNTIASPPANAPCVDPSLISARIEEYFAGEPYRLFLAEPIPAPVRQAPFRVDSEHLLGAGRPVGETSRPTPTVAPAANRLSVMVVPCLEDGDLVLAVRFSAASGCWNLEFPGSDDHDEDEGWLGPAESSLAGCGLLTEDRMTILGALRPDFRQQPQSLLVLLADDCQWITPSANDAVEPPAGLVAAAPRVIDKLARAGKIECARTLAALQLARDRI